MKKIKLIIIIALLLVIALPVVKAESNDNASTSDRGYYTYDYWGNVMASAPAYKYQREASFKDLNLTDASKFTGVHYFNDRIYIIDEGLNAIHILDYDLNLLETINSFDNNGITDSFKTPKAVYVDNKNCIYVADTGNSRLVKLNPDYSLALIITKPDHLALEGMTFVPIDVSVSYTGRIYVVGQNVYSGIMELNEKGEFLRFVGTNKVSLSLWELFARAITSVEQKEFANLVLPQEFRSIDVDDKGFVYATSFTIESPIKRINSNGADVLYKNWFFEPIGDVDKNLIVGSEFIAISASDHGIYMALDRNAGRIFVYDCDGEMLYVLGGIQRQDNYFLQPVDIEWMKNDDICVVDTQKSSVIVFSATEFGQTVNQAARYHYDGLYEEALEYWTKARKYNANYDLAYVGIGKAYLYTNQYEEAMEYFKLGNNRTYYSQAYQKQSSVFIKENFGYFVAAIAIIVVLTNVPKIVKYVKSKKEGEIIDD